MRPARAHTGDATLQARDLVHLAVCRRRSVTRIGTSDQALAEAAAAE